MRPTGEHARFSPHLLENAKKAPAPWCVGCAALYQGRSPPSGRHVTQMVWDEKCLRRGASPSFGRNGVQGVITRSETASLRVLALRSEEHTSELQSLMRNSYAVFCLKKKK